MQLIYPDGAVTEGWLAGPWNSRLSLALGYARVANAEPHYHAEMREVFVVIAGSGELMVAGQTRRVETGAAGIVEPGEVHRWRRATHDFRLVVVHEPYVAGDMIVVAEA